MLSSKVPSVEISLSGNGCQVCFLTSVHKEGKSVSGKVRDLREERLTPLWARGKRWLKPAQERLEH